MKINNKKAAGFSLVELMVALSIGMILLAATSSILVSSKKTYTLNDSLARLQENGRIAMQIISRDIRATGYFGCADDISSINNGLVDEDAFSFSGKIRLEAVDFGNASSISSATWTPSTNLVSDLNLDPPPLPNTDAIAMRLGRTVNADLDVEMNQESSEMKINKLTTGITTGDILMITDCSSADIFQVTNYQQDTGGFDHILHTKGGGPTGVTPGNKEGSLVKSYGEDAKFLKFDTIVYYIATGASNEPSLFRASLVKGVLITQELVEGVENLQLLYGKDLNSDRIPDVYLPANGPVGESIDNGKSGVAALTIEWSNVVSVRVAILARSLANLDTSENKAGSQLLDTGSYDLNEDGSADYNASTDTDNQNRQYQRRIFRTTLLMRNMQ